MLSRWAINTREGCGCTALSRKMDKLGPDGCAAQLDELAKELIQSVKQWRKVVQEDAEATLVERAVPQPPLFTARQLIRWSITQSRKEQ